MVSYLRLNHFIESANQAFTLSTQNKSLVASPQGAAVSLCDIPKNSSPTLADQNRRTWGIFRETLVETIGQNKFNWICQRYRSRMNYARMEASGSPLLPEHVELFTIGSSQLLSTDIKTRFPEKLSSLTCEQLKERIRVVQPFPIVGRHRGIHGASKSFLANLFHNKLLMDKQKQLIFSNVACLSFRQWIERFAKEAVNKEYLEKQLIPAPGQNGGVEYYKVYRKIATGD